MWYLYPHQRLAKISDFLERVIFIVPRYLFVYQNSVKIKFPHGLNLLNRPIGIECVVAMDYGYVIGIGTNFQ